MRCGTSQCVLLCGGKAQCKRENKGDPGGSEGWSGRDRWLHPGAWEQLLWRPSALPVPPAACCLILLEFCKPIKSLSLNKFAVHNGVLRVLSKRITWPHLQA